MLSWIDLSIYIVYICHLLKFCMWCVLMYSYININNMSLLRNFFQGIKKSESRRYFELMKNLQPVDLPENEWQRLAKIFKQGFIVKLIAVPSAVALGYFIPLPPDLGYPTFTRCFISLVGYRVFVLQSNSKIYNEMVIYLIYTGYGCAKSKSSK